MATLGIQYREAKAMRMHMEQLAKRVRHEAERDAAELGRQRAIEHAAALRREADRIERAARVTGAVVTNVWVDHPTAEGD